MTRCCPLAATPPSPRAGHVATQVAGERIGPGLTLGGDGGAEQPATFTTARHAFP